MKLIRTLIVSILILSSISFFIPLKINATGNTYYVSKSGNDSHTGLGADSGHAWLTIQKAASTMVAGDTVEIEAGTYNEQVHPTNSGTAGNYITYENYGTDAVIISGSGVSVGYLFYISDLSYI